MSHIVTIRTEIRDAEAFDCSAVIAETFFTRIPKAPAV